jgi:hypothetical protein
LGRLHKFKLKPKVIDKRQKALKKAAGTEQNFILVHFSKRRQQE